MAKNIYPQTAAAAEAGACAKVKKEIHENLLSKKEYETLSSFTSKFINIIRNEYSKDDVTANEKMVNHLSRLTQEIKFIVYKNLMQQQIEFNEQDVSDLLSCCEFGYVYGRSSWIQRAKAIGYSILKEVVTTSIDLKLNDVTKLLINNVVVIGAVHILSEAVNQNDKDFVNQLIRAGADVNKGNFRGLCTPLEMVIINNNLDILNILLDANVNINSKDLEEKSQYTPLHKAVAYGSLKVIEKLINANADLGAKTFLGKTALDLAKEKKDQDIIKLLQRKVDEQAALNENAKPESAAAASLVDQENENSSNNQKASKDSAHAIADPYPSSASSAGANEAEAYPARMEIADYNLYFAQSGVSNADIRLGGEDSAAAQTSHAE